MYHIPHDQGHHLHHHLVQSLKESFQRRSLVAHPTKNNPEHNREHHQAKHIHSSLRSYKLTVWDGVRGWVDHLGYSGVVVGAIAVDFHGVIWVKCAHIDCFVVRLDLRGNRLVLCIFLVEKIALSI